MSKDNNNGSIDLGGGWSVEPDPSCWILKEAKAMPKSKVEGATYDKCTYHPTLESALRAYADEKTRGETASGILKAIKALHAGIREALEAHVALAGPIEDRRALERPVEKERRRKAA